VVDGRGRLCRARRPSLNADAANPPTAMPLASQSAPEPATDAPPRVGWICSLPRCGSSVAVYAAAAPFGLRVADEPFGPWDRTTPPYNYPQTHLDLIAAFRVAGETINEDVAPIVDRLFREFAALANEGRGDPEGRVVAKSPHLEPPPKQIAALPGHRVIVLLRNPLHRVNSLYARGWLESCGPNYDLERFRLLARSWRAAEHRLLYDQLRADPRAFFRAVYDAWGWDATDADVERAVAYASGHYHDSSLGLAKRDPKKPLSERKRRLPREAIEAYLGDEEIAGLMREVGWSTDAADYRRKGLFA